MWRILVLCLFFSGCIKNKWLSLFNRILKTGKYRGDLEMVIYSDIFMCVSDLALFVCTVFSGFI